MTIPYAQIPANQRIGLFSAEFSEKPSERVDPGVRLPVMMGQKLPAAPAVVGTRYLITRTGEAATWFGRGSPLHGMAIGFFRRYPTGKFYAICQTDNGSGVAGSRALTLTGPATETRELALYIAGVKRPVSVTSGMIATAIATAVVAAVVDDDPVTAAVGGTGNEHIVTFTSKVKGTVANQISIALNPLGQAGAEQLPAGVGVTLAGSYALESGGLATQLASGATNPTAANWASYLGSAEPYSLIGFQMSDETEAAVLQAQLDPRWDALAAKDGVLLMPKMDSAADLLTYFAARNDWRVSVLGVPEAYGHLFPLYEAVGAYVGIIQRRCVSSGRPVANEQNTPLGVYGGGKNFTDTERNDLADGGGATFYNENGVSYLEFAGSTRRLTDHGDPETRYPDIQVALGASWLRQYFKVASQTAFPRHNIAKDNDPIPGGAELISPAGLEAWIIAKYAALATLNGGIAGSLEDFKEKLVVEPNETNPQRLDASIEPSFFQRWRVFGMNIAIGG